jgi:hypothetical protein
MRTLIATALTVAFMQAHVAHAIQMATPELNNMVKTCTLHTGEVADAACQAFVLGVAETTAFYAGAGQMTPQFCIPADVAPAQLLAVYRSYLKNNHVLRQFSAAALTVSSFKQSYPCE